LARTSDQCRDLRRWAEVARAPEWGLKPLSWERVLAMATEDALAWAERERGRAEVTGKPMSAFAWGNEAARARYHLETARVRAHAKA
jgi:hypothetical protein